MLHLYWQNYNDTAEWHAMMRYLLKQFLLARDSGLHSVTYDEYKELRAKGEVEGYEGCWNENGGRVAAVHTSYYTQFSTTWQLINSAKDDFFAGWEAHEKYVRMLEDWDDAITEQWWRDYGNRQWRKRLKEGDTPKTEKPATRDLWGDIHALWDVWDVWRLEELLAELDKHHKEGGWTSNFLDHLYQTNYHDYELLTAYINK